MLWASALLDEWTCSSVKLIKWESLASHLLSLQATGCRFVGTFRLRDLALTSCSADINARSIRWNSSIILHGVGRSIIILFIKMQIYKGLLLIMVWGFKVYSCVHVHTYPCIYVFTSTWIHLKEEDQNIIIRWKGGKMKEDAVSQCPSRRMDMQ